MSNQLMQTIEHEGREYKLGCLVPEVRPMSFAAYADAGPMLTKEQSLKILTDPNRTPSRKRFAGRTWIWNQGQVGSCNGYAGAGALARARVRRGLAYIKLSGESLYAQINGGRDVGSMLDDGMKAIQKTGVSPAELVRHETYLWRDVSAEARAAMSRFKAEECYRVDTEEELIAGLAMGFDGVLAVHVTRGFYNINSEGLVGNSDGAGNHAVCVDDVRFVNGVFEFDMANSWDLTYGTQGRGYLRWRNHLSNTVKHHCFYLVRTTIDDPKGDNPPQLIG